MVGANTSGASGEASAVFALQVLAIGLRGGGDVPRH